MHNMSGGKTALGLDANVGAMICYLGNLICVVGLIYSIIVVATDKENRLARFHAFQSIFLTIASLVIYIPFYVMMVMTWIMDSSSAISGLLSLAVTAFGLAVLVFTIVAAIKSYNGEFYKIPVIGDFAEKYSA